MFAFDSIDKSSWGGDRANADDRAMADVVNSCWIAFIKMDAGQRSFECGGVFSWNAFGDAAEAAIFNGNGAQMVPAGELPDGPPENKQ